MANKQILALNSTVNLDDVCFVSDLEARQLVKQNKAYWDILDNNIPKERVLVFSSPGAFYKKKGLIPMEKHYMIDIQNRNADERVEESIKQTQELNKMISNDHELTSLGLWAEPDKVKAIRETIESVMKNFNTTDIRDIDLDMLSSCINATINREKMYYEWLNEFTSAEVDEYTIKFAFEFLDWVLLNKIDKHSAIYFKK